MKRALQPVQTFTHYLRKGISFLPSFRIRGHNLLRTLFVDSSDFPAEIRTVYEEGTALVGGHFPLDTLLAQGATCVAERFL